MAQFPEIIDTAYENLEPQYIASYLQQLASLFHKFYSHCKVITEDNDLTIAKQRFVYHLSMLAAAHWTEIDMNLIRESRWRSEAEPLMRRG